MSVIPEIILQRAIITGLQAVRQDTRIVGMLYKNLPLAQQEAIKNFFQTKKIDFSINYPRKEIAVPAIVLLLKTESEEAQFVGDLMGAPPNYDMPDSDVTIDTLGGSGAATVSPMSGLPPLVIGGLHVESQVPPDTSLAGSHSVSLVLAEDDRDRLSIVFSERDNWPRLNAHIVAGAGAGQVKSISFISYDRLDIAGIFDVNCNNTSVVDIRYAEHQVDPVYGEPQRLYDAGTNGLSQLRVGANYTVQYQLEILAGNQEEVIYLYTMLKAILFAQRKFLEAQGIMALRLSGTDLGFRGEFLPDEIFVRSLTLQFIYPFNFIIEQEVARAIEITLTNVNPVSPVPTPGDEVPVATIDITM